MARVLPTPQSRADAVRKQVKFIRSSCTAFDRGDGDESIRLAHALRVLLHDTDSSTSALFQSGFKNKLSFVDTAAAGTSGARIGGMQFDVEWELDDGTTFLSPMGQDGLVQIALAAGIPNYIPNEAASSRGLPFEDWWSTPAIDIAGGRKYSRKALVLEMANSDGGSHYDPKGVDQRYDDLTRVGQGAFWSNQGSVEDRKLEGVGPVVGNAAAATMRQIAQEVLETLDASPGLQAWIRSPK